MSRLGSTDLVLGTDQYHKMIAKVKSTGLDLPVMGTFIKKKKKTCLCALVQQLLKSAGFFLKQFLEN